MISQLSLFAGDPQAVAASQVGIHWLFTPIKFYYAIAPNPADNIDRHWYAIYVWGDYYLDFRVVIFACLIIIMFLYVFPKLSRVFSKMQRLAAGVSWVAPIYMTLIIIQSNQLLGIWIILVLQITILAGLVSYRLTWPYVNDQLRRYMKRQIKD